MPALYFSSPRALSSYRVTEHDVTFCSHGWCFSGVSDLNLWKISKSQSEIKQTTGTCWLLLKASISEVADKGEFRQNSNSSNVPALELAVVISSSISVLMWNRLANPKQNGVGNVCITLIFPFQDMYCSTEASLARWMKTGHFSKCMLKKSTLRGFFQCHLCKNISQMGVYV